MTSQNGLPHNLLSPEKAVNAKVRETPVFRTALSLHRQNATLHPQTACVEACAYPKDGEKEARHYAFSGCPWYEPGPYTPADHRTAVHRPPGHRQRIDAESSRQRRKYESQVAPAQQLLIRGQEDCDPHLRHRRSRDLQTSPQFVSTVVAPSGDVLNKGHPDVIT